MRITGRELRQIIKEELRRVMKESDATDKDFIILKGVAPKPETAAAMGVTQLGEPIEGTFVKSSVGGAHTFAVASDDRVFTSKNLLSPSPLGIDKLKPGEYDASYKLVSYDGTFEITVLPPDSSILGYKKAASAK